jgi:hypothetical protein
LSPPSPAATFTPSNAAWAPDPVFMEAKASGRVVIDSSGNAAVMPTAPPETPYPAAAKLDTTWSGQIQEPPKSGKDDKGVRYSDKNYALMCGPGTGAVVLSYWPASRNLVKSKSGTFVEPVNVGGGRYAATYWKAVGAAGYARGMIMFLAEVEWPTPDKGLKWWPTPGLLNWKARPPSTNRENLLDAINWEASGRTTVNYFYAIVPASQLTADALLDHVHADISAGVPVVIAARTSDGKHALPDWRVRSTKTAGNHFVAVVGYDDKAGTYAVMDTCGLTCNDRGVRGRVMNIGQTALFSLIQAESDDDGIIW